ncbi:SirB1 family protein [Rhodohalobacter halophilus]|uniref:SirB1 family protein n=1 Tax=Rhodohalobacter halophilus TaxID=1812810 RepID=UPI00083F5130|nr:transglutaminase-like domain-containing protein [Rhodohalobacter halophilus]
MTTKSEIESLIYLLDDPDPEVQSGVHSRLRELGEDAVPLLDEHKNETRGEQEKEFINNIIYNITIGSLIEEYAELMEEGVHDARNLERAVLMLAKFGSPTLRIEEYSRKLDILSREISADIAYTPSLREKMQIILQYVFRELRFRGDSANYHHPDNALLNRVIDRRKGLPIMLGLVVMFLGRRLNLPFYGVNMPIHFLLLYKTPSEGVLIDPFDGGTIVTYDQCYYFLKKNGVEPRPDHLKQADESEILARCIRNLINSYSKQNQERKVKDLRQLLHLTELKG